MLYSNCFIVAMLLMVGSCKCMVLDEEECLFFFNDNNGCFSDLFRDKSDGIDLSE